MSAEIYIHKRTGMRVQIIGKRLNTERGLLYVTRSGLAIEAEQILAHFEREG